MSASTDLVTAKKNLAGALGENMTLYLQLLKSWFKQKTSREDFDHEARKLLTMDSVHLHNQFMLAILAKCQSLGSPISKSSMEGTSTGTIVHSPTKQKKTKAKKRTFPTSPKVTFNQRLVSVHPLATAPQIPPHPPDTAERSPGFASRDLLLLEAGVVHCRVLVTAWEHGLDDIQDEAAILIMKAIQVQLKNILSAVFSRRSGYKVREKRFKYAFGCDLPDPSLRNTNFVEDYSTECEATSVTVKGHHMPSIAPTPELGLRNAAMETAASASYATPTKGKVTLMDLYSTLQLHKSTIPSHTVYATNMERLVQRMWHPTNEELEQERLHKQEVKLKQEAHTRQQLSAVTIRS